MEKLLLDADMLDRASQIKAWYDGYHFGASDVYCPWDVMNYLLDCQKSQMQGPSVTGKIPAITRSSVRLSTMPEAISR